jgi:hypothetical protein
MESKPILPDELNPCSQVRRTSLRIYEKSKTKGHAQSVYLFEENIQGFLNDLESKLSETGIAFEPWAKYHIDPNAYNIEQVLAYTFVVDAMNFCFWPRNPPGQFEYEHMTKNLAKILDSDPSYFLSENLAKTTSEWLKKEIFNSLDFALLEERARIVREVGLVISTEYSGSFVEYLKRAHFDAVFLVRQIAKDFTGFRDEAIYDCEQVFFYKRAQILVADLYGALDERNSPKDGQTVPEFTNLEQLTMFADYRVP